MYQPLLTRKYLTTKVMPLLAAVGVTLCVCMVLVVWSVMGGFLNTLLASGKQLTGDVIIQRSGNGLPHYAELVERLETRPEVAAATAIVQTVGLLNFPDFNAQPQYVQVVGIDPDEYTKVTGFADQLYWRPLQQPLPADDERADPRLDEPGLNLIDPPVRRVFRLAPPAGVTEDAVNRARDAWTAAVDAARAAESPTDARTELIGGAWDARAALQAGVPRDGLDDADPDVIALNAALTDAFAARRSLELRNSLAGRLDDLAARGALLRAPDQRTGEPRDAAVLGLAVNGIYDRSPAGFVSPPSPAFFMPDREVVVSVVALSGKGAAQDTTDLRFPVANEFRTGMYDVDSRFVIVPRQTLQRMLGMETRPRIDPAWRPGRVAIDPTTGEVAPQQPPIIGQEPARATAVLVRAAPGVDESQLLPVARAVYDAFELEQPEAAPAMFVDIFPWDERPGLKTFIAAVKKETALVLFLFSLISLTAVVLILAIFWSMVSEKTKDIGILRSVGASRLGVTWLFLRYGLAIGLVGSVIGSGLAILIVVNINAIHASLQQWLGLTIWDPSIYYFFRIPSDIEADKLAIVFAGGVIASALGALIPAIRAASLDPVKALRFE